MTFMEQVETFFINLWASLGATVTSALMKLVWALLVLVIGLKVAKWIVKKVDKSKRMQKVEPTVHMFTSTALSIALKVVVIRFAIALEDIVFSDDRATIVQMVQRLFKPVGEVFCIDIRPAIQSIRQFTQPVPCFSEQ